MRNKPRLLTPGPTPLPELVRLNLALDMIHHRKDQFVKIMRDVQQSLQTLFGTSSPVLPLGCSGTGAMTAAAYSLFKPGEKVAVIEAGKFGERWKKIAQSRQLDVVVEQIEWGKVARPEQVEALLKKNPEIRGIFMQLCETSTAVLQPVREIAEIVSKTDALLVVDGISAVGISPCPMDEWKIDCLLTGSQKGLMLPPGLALIALSPRAWDIAEATPPGCFYFNLPKEREKLEQGQTLFTTPVNLIRGLEASMEILLKDGLEAVYRHQWALTMLVRAGIRSIGLEPLAAADYSWGVTAIKMPAGINAQDVNRIAQQKYGVVMAGGQDALKGKIIRLGHMGWLDWGDCMAGLAALGESLKEAGGFTPAGDYMPAALNAYNAALAVSPGVVPPSLNI